VEKMGVLYSVVLKEACPSL